MKQLSYPKKSETWVKLYHSPISEWDKFFTAAAFKISEEENINCIIFVILWAYGTGIYNFDINLIIQLDLPMSFDTMIERINYVRKKK